MTGTLLSGRRAAGPPWRRGPRPNAVKPRPGHTLQIGVGFPALVAAHILKYCEYTAIDDRTRIRVLKIFDADTPQCRRTGGVNQPRETSDVRAGRPE